MSHLRPDEIIDAVEDTLAPARRTHLSSCPACQDQVGQLTAVLATARRVEVPEPSPLFWDRLSARVRESVNAEPTTSGHVSQWWQWPVLTPLTALTLIVLALVSSVARDPLNVPTAPAVVEGRTESVEEPSAADAAWLAFADLVGPIDIDTAQKAGIATALGTAEHVALQMSTLEQEELLRLLQVELKRTGS